MFTVKKEASIINDNMRTNLIVRKTSDFSIFKTMDGNRPPNPQHIRRLKDSMMVNGVLCNPIIVNEFGYVIDGQHRLIAAKESD